MKEFEQFLHEYRVLPEKRRPYYLRWVSKFLRFLGSDADSHLPHERIPEFLREPGKPMRKKGTGYFSQVSWMIASLKTRMCFDGIIQFRAVLLTISLTFSSLLKSASIGVLSPILKTKGLVLPSSSSVFMYP